MQEGWVLGPLCVKGEGAGLVIYGGACAKQRKTGLGCWALCVLMGKGRASDLGEVCGMKGAKAGTNELSHRLDVPLVFGR